MALAIPLLTGGLSALITSGNMKDFDSVSKPPFSPPGWLFPVVWTILFILMGLASYIVWEKSSGKPRQTALTLYALQLIFNFFWSIIFFNAKAYLFAFIWLVALLLLIIATTLAFGRISKVSAYLMIPYILWVAFAGYLTFGIYLLNR